MNESTPAIRQEDSILAAEAAVSNDLSKLSGEKRVALYGAVCRSIGLNPLTQPFLYINLGGKLTLYAAKGATDQLRKINGISITSIEKELIGDVLMVTASATDKTGRMDSDIGAVSLGALKGEALANAHMKALTKAKRRVTLSISGLGFLDDSEVESIPGAQRVNVDLETGEIQKPAPVKQQAPRRATKVTAEVQPPEASEDDRIDVFTELAAVAKKHDMSDDLIEAAFIGAGLDPDTCDLGRVRTMMTRINDAPDSFRDWAEKQQAAQQAKYDPELNPSQAELGA